MQLKSANEEILEAGQMACGVLTLEAGGKLVELAPLLSAGLQRAEIVRVRGLGDVIFAAVARLDMELLFAVAGIQVTRRGGGVVGVAPERETDAMNAVCWAMEDSPPPTPPGDPGDILRQIFEGEVQGEKRRELIEQILNRGLAEFGVLRVLPENIAAQPALVGTAPSLLVRSQEFGHARNLGRWRMPWELIEERVRQNPPPARLYDDVMKDLQDGWAYGMRETPRP